MRSSALRVIRDEFVDRLPIDPARLAEANINPRTRLATDYLNHFNEAIMLLELVPDMPECADDMLAWSPLSYCEHFIASNFSHRDLAIAAYDEVEPRLRRRFDEVCHTMNAFLLMVRDSIALKQAPDDVAALAEEAVLHLKPLVARAGGMINGIDGDFPDAGSDAAAQAAVDALLDR